MLHLAQWQNALWIMNHKRASTATAAEPPLKRVAGGGRQPPPQTTATTTTPPVSRTDSGPRDDNEHKHPLPFLREVWNAIPADKKQSLPAPYSISEFTSTKGPSTGKQMLSFKVGDKTVCGFSLSYAVGGHQYTCKDAECHAKRAHDLQPLVDWMLATKQSWSNLKLSPKFEQGTKK